VQGAPLLAEAEMIFMTTVTEEKEIPINMLYINGENVRKEVGDTCPGASANCAPSRSTGLRGCFCGHRGHEEHVSHLPIMRDGGQEEPTGEV
jgi:hypothetical protein